MLPFDLTGARRLLVLGAHCDDVDIGCGGTLLHLCKQHPDLEVKWVTFSGDAARKAETEAAAGAFLQAASGKSIEVLDFKDGFFPWEGAKMKERFEEIAGAFSPDVVFTHRRDDRHQDHRVVAELAWNTFRDQLLLEYEIPKWEGDLGQPNLYVPLSADICRRKIAFLMDFYTESGWPGLVHRGSLLGDAPHPRCRVPIAERIGGGVPRVQAHAARIRQRGEMMPRAMERCRLAPAFSDTPAGRECPWTRWPAVCCEEFNTSAEWQ